MLILLFNYLDGSYKNLLIFDENEDHEYIAKLVSEKTKKTVTSKEIEDGIIIDNEMITLIKVII